jgi:D-alanyl-D-alanine carboxypeptidase/D-alanyl-D-alanine-endopeptidase (penicillin-binding protein 4)
VRIGPQPPPEEPDPEPEKPVKRRRRGLLLVLGAVVLVLAVGAGVVYAVPDLREKLGFGGSEPAPVIAPPPDPVTFKPALRPPGADAATPSAAGVKAALAGPTSAGALGGLTGTVVDPATGTVLWNQKADQPLTPASTGKVLTAAAALLKLDHGQQFATKVVAGRDPGTVVLVGGGDPTLSSLPAGKNSVYPGAARLDDLVAQVKANAGGKVTQVLVDISRYTGDGLAPGWLPGDVAEGYIAPIVPAMMDGARAEPAKERSPRSGNPARALALELAKRLGATVPQKAEGAAPEGAKVLGEVRSAPLTELVDNFLQISDNVLAETVAREVAKAAGEEPSFAGVSRATLKILQDSGFDVTGGQMTDGSGLSTQDHIPARLLGAVLAVAAGPDGKDPRTAKLRPMLGGLPVAGGSGTLEDRFLVGDPAAPGRGWVRAKTGTLSTANTLAGVVLDTDGRLLAFALMTANPDAKAARAALDTVAAALRGCGCK